MASEFQDCLEQIKNLTGKDVEDIKEEFIEEICRVYVNNTRGFLTLIYRGGFPANELIENESLDIIIFSFLKKCNGLNVEQLSKIFSKLHDKNQGLKILKYIKERLEKTILETEIEEPPPQIPTRKILVLSANPTKTSQLRLDEEIREIKEALKRSRKRDQFEIETLEAVRYRDIHRAILDHKPNIVHFSGHGKGKEGLMFEDETGQVKLVDSDALAGLFEVFAKQIECVVLNACYSEVQAKEISRHIENVIGMSQSIQDRAAIEFVVGFYDGLGDGQSYERSYQLGCSLIRTAGIPGNLIPQLLGKNHPGFSQPPPPIRETPSPTEKIVSPPPSVSPRGENISDFREDTISRTVSTIYEQLEEDLANEEWKKADLKTMRLMIEIADNIESSNQVMKDREIITWLDNEDIKKIPDEALKTIDQLWVKYSQGHFGFSVQAKIWLECGGKQDEFDFIISPNKFAKNLGWHDGRNWIKRYDQFDFSIEAKRGHLPSLSFPNKKNQFLDLITWTKTFKHLLPRLFSCGLTL